MGREEQSFSFFGIRDPIPKGGSLGPHDTASPLPLCDVCPQRGPSLPPCWSRPWLELSVPPSPGGLTPDGISNVPGVPSGASFSSSGWGPFRVHHVRRASWRERKYCLTQLSVRNRHRAESGGLALSPNALSFEQLRPSEHLL